MANDTTKVTAGQPKTGGAAFIGETTTTLPTNASTALTGFDCLGYVSEDGLTDTPTTETTDIKDWGGSVVLSPQTSKSNEYSATFIEAMNVNVLKMAYGDGNVTEADGKIAITENSDELPAKAFVFDMIWTGDVPARIVIPNGKITNIGEITYNRSNAIGYKVTIKALPDASGNRVYKYIG